MSTPQETVRPLYRHIIVKSRGLTESVATPEELQRLRRQLEVGDPVDPDLQHLVVQNTLEGTMKKALKSSKWSNRADAEVVCDEDGVDPTAVMEQVDLHNSQNLSGPVKYRGQQGVIVKRLNQKHIPGGTESLPSKATRLEHPGFEQATDPVARYLECVTDLQKKFQDYSDQKFLLMDKDLRSSVTLVTVCFMPITASPRAYKGMELFCEFHQTTRFGSVDTDGFEVYSETGVFPHTPVSNMDMALIMKPADETLASR